MAMNLELHRSDESVWDRADDRLNWDTERWLLGAVAAGFLFAGLRRRSVTGLALILITAIFVAVMLTLNAFCQNAEIKEMIGLTAQLIRHHGRG